MTPLRQVFHAAVVAAGLAVAVPSSAEPLAVMGPPTAEDAAALAAAEAPPAPPVVAAPVTAPSGAKAPGWLASRPVATPKAAAGRSPLPSLGRIIGLFLVVGSLGGAALYFKRRGAGERKRVTLPQRLSVISSTRIGPKAHAVVISVAGRQMLLGVTDASVKRLAFIDELVEDEEGEREREREREPVRRPAPQAAVRSTASPSRATSLEIPLNPSFGSMLKTAFTKRDRQPQHEEDAASILAAETHDVVAGKPATAKVTMLDVEGQAQGLIRRLSGPRS